MPLPPEISIVQLERRISLLEAQTAVLADTAQGRTPLVWWGETLGFVPDGVIDRVTLTFVPEPPRLLMLFSQGTLQHLRVPFGQNVELGWAPPTAMGAAQFVAVYPYDPDRVLEPPAAIAACLRSEREYDHETDEEEVFEPYGSAAPALVALGLA